MSRDTSGHDATDFEMSDARETSKPASTSSAPALAADVKPPLTSPSGSTSSTHTNDDDDDDSDDSESLADVVEVISVSSREGSLEPATEGEGTGTVVKSESRDSASPSAKPASSASQAGPSTIPATVNVLTAKPKSARIVKPRSPSPTPPPPPPPMQTIRLEFPLGGPDNYEVHIAHLARDSGQRAPTPVRVLKPPPESDSESEKEPEAGGSKPVSKARKKRKSAAAEYYDVHDPFIDDSELALDERTYFAQTKQQGFYVSSGEVALLKDKPIPSPAYTLLYLLPFISFPDTQTLTPPLLRTPRKIKPRKSGKADATAITADTGSGTKDAPIALGSDDEGAVPGQKRKRYATVWENGKKRRVVNQEDFHPDIQAAVEELKRARDKEDWNTKGKFPPSIKPLLAQTALTAVERDEYDEHFFNLMATLFPYNKFTITKLIKRTIFQDHVNLLNQRQVELLAQLAS
ncbi:hypothetical protein HWV62_41156, partial [Athelia sp. TMB]